MPNEDSKYIGRQLKKHRVQKGLTQAAVAKKVGTNTNYYAKLERGVAVPSLKMLKKAIKAVGTHSSDILPF